MRQRSRCIRRAFVNINTQICTKFPKIESKNEKEIKAIAIAQKSEGNFSNPFNSELLSDSMEEN